jgi:hypothetical protein
MTHREKLENERTEVTHAMKQAEYFELSLCEAYDCRRSFDWVRYHVCISAHDAHGAPIRLKGRYRSTLLIPLLVQYELSIVSSAEYAPLHLLIARERWGERPFAGRVLLRFLKADNADARATLERRAEQLYTDHHDIILWQRQTFPVPSLIELNEAIRSV